MKIHFRLFSDFFLIALGACLLAGWISYWEQFFSPYQDKVDIDLSLLNLPRYTFYSLSRGLLAYFLSLLFSLLWGFWAAKDRIAEKAVIPLLDVLQSIPFLGFLPGIVLLLIGFFQKREVGLELAAIFLIFTAQVWNMAFGVYHAIRTVPTEKNECASSYRFSGWERAKWIELPFSMLSLVWNSIMSMAGGWFFLMVNESFKLGDRDFRIPGLGSYMSVAAGKGDGVAMFYAIVSMFALILFLDQLLWRPLVVWSQKFRIEETGPPIVAESWFLNILKSSYIIALFRASLYKLGRFMQNRKSKTRDFVRKWLPIAISRIALGTLAALLMLAAYSIVRLLIPVRIEQWVHLFQMMFLTLGRVFVCVFISTCLALPLGLAIGLSEKWSRVLQPLMQIGASFPATLLFPIFVLAFKLAHIPLGIGSIVLMLMGTQWYILFNVMAGAKAMPSDLREVASSFRFSRNNRFRWLYFPSLFPYLITGVITASGGAWNASIVSEYVTYQDKVWTTPGLGSTISLAAQNNDYSLLAASIFVMVIVVALLNLQVWLRLYRYSEKRYALNA